MELHLEAFDTIATGLLRDAEGGWIRGYCRRVGVCSAIRAELWAIHNRLLIAWREGIMKVLLESDSRKEEKKEKKKRNEDTLAMVVLFLQGGATTQFVAIH
ncbi:hypothetical protein PVK06_015665 [Gossypium arboreum]|uniref:RNase H type-1 domain-containing protein n=1 Tax=Gossypium arboreum TaxID=29729 RepID=A0ABR0PXY4_GOSAR|nr:hypothetical protein PVK06_015665 [Gossypium arboreum]